MEIAILPRWFIKHFSQNFLRQNDLNILLSNLIIILIFVLFKNTFISILNMLPHFCLFDKLTDIECPFCGTTRAFCELVNGSLKNAYALNISSYLVASFFIAQIPSELFHCV